MTDAKAAGTAVRSEGSATSGAAVDQAASDALLLAAYARGEMAAATQLSERHTPRVLALAYRMLGDLCEAEDVAQEVMLKLWGIAPDWQPQRARLSTWLYRVTANACTDRLRRRTRCVALDVVAPAAAAEPAAPDLLQQRQRHAALQEALNGLPPRQRLALILRYLEELPSAEVAQVMCISVHAVDSLAARGRAALADALFDRRADLGYRDD